MTLLRSNFFLYFSAALYFIFDRLQSTKTLSIDIKIYRIYTQQDQIV